MFKIMIIEDEVKLREELKVFLNNNGFETSIMDDYSNAVNNIVNGGIDLVLLDINLPNINGQFICHEVRKTSNIPIIIVTSKNTEIDEVLSINYGADDFVTKPYNPQILLARINRLLNRSNGNDNIITYKDIVLDVYKSTINVNGEVMDLSKNEFKIFYFLLKNKGKIVSRDELMNYLWDTFLYIDDNTLTVNINRLRSKLGDLGYEDVILTKRGQGYIIL